METLGITTRPAPPFLPRGQDTHSVAFHRGPSPPDGAPNTQFNHKD